MRYIELFHTRTQRNKNNGWLSALDLIAYSRAAMKLLTYPKPVQRTFADGGHALPAPGSAEGRCWGCL